MKINIPPSIQVLPDRCFYQCSSLTELILPQLLIRIGVHCFCRCSNLCKINIPASVHEIGKWCFSECTKLFSWRGKIKIEKGSPFTTKTLKDL
jgi:hypothetical protein